jgi:hypothetical protein
LLVGLWFAMVFGGAEWWTAQQTRRVRVHLDAELSLPLIPSFTLVYMSIYVLFLGVPFVLRKRSEFTRLALAQSVTILLAGLGFLLFPAQTAYAPPDAAHLGLWKGLFQIADRLNLDYNLVPSLHVALSVVCLEMFAVHATRAGRWLLRSWGLAIAASTLFTHQHHLVDAVAGYALALAVVAGVRRAPH